MPKKKNKVIEKTRRANGEGSIYQRKDGVWTGKIWIEQADGTKIRKTVYGKSESEVSKKLSEITGNLQIYKNKFFNNKNFGAMFTDWLMVFKKPTVTPRTFEGCVRNYNNHIKPYLSSMELININQSVLQQLINELLSKNLAPATVKKVKFLLNQFFEYCCDAGL